MQNIPIVPPLLVCPLFEGELDNEIQFTILWNILSVTYMIQFSTQFRTGYTSESFVIYMNASGCIS